MFKLSLATASSQLLKTAGYYRTISSAFASDILQYTKLTV
jgi:hypothetical protein